MKKSFYILALFCLSVWTVGAQTLQQGFENPGNESRPRVWWHWMDGNITLDGVRKDLQWMQRAGIGGVHNFDAGLLTPQMIPNRLAYMTPAWCDVFEKAVNMADSMGMEFTIPSAPGWSATGGPWVENKDGMKKLTWREVQVEGILTGQRKAQTAKLQHIQLPPVSHNTSSFQNFHPVDLQKSLAKLMGIEVPDVPAKEFSEQIAVLAVRRGQDDLTMTQLGAKVTSSGGEGITVEALTDGDLDNACNLATTPDNSRPWIQYEFDEPKTMRAVSFCNGLTRDEFGGNPAQSIAQLLVSNDGSNWRVLCDIPACFVPQTSFNIPVTTARYWRVTMDNPQPDMTYFAYTGVAVPAAPFTKVPEFRLWPVTRVNHSEEKAGFAAPWDLHQFETPSALPTEVATIEQVIDLTDKVDADGVLHWAVPEGNWTIYRFGWSLTGKENHPASAEATGLEVDKMDPIAMEKYLRTYLDMYKRASNGKMGQHGIQYILHDSYEAQQNTWTPAMFTEFERRRGYSLLPWMPALTGQIINSTAETEQFLSDWRMTLGELITECYDLTGRLVKEQYGMKGRYSESHENGRLYIVDGMDVKRNADIPMSALWCNYSKPEDYVPETAVADIRESASVAHLYGQNLVAAESMTVNGPESGEAYSFYPARLKRFVDAEFAAGVNRIVVHTSQHQPSDTLRPGASLMVFGQWFHRHETWAEQARAWTDYLARTSYMLQQGHFVADVLWYYGEDTNVTAFCTQNGGVNIPRGYAYDFCSPHATSLLKTAADGTLQTESGMKYKLLVIDPSVRQMSLDVLRRLVALGKAGAMLYGSIPAEPLGRKDDVAEWYQLRDELASLPTMHQAAHEQLLNVLTAASQPDVFFDRMGYLKLPFVHRQTSEAEIYWVSNPTTMPLTVEATFRTQGRKPMLWRPETGKIEELSYRFTNDGRTTVSLPLVSEDAVFVVFEQVTDVAQYQLPLVEENVQTVLEGSWKVTFQEGQGAPASTTLEELKSLTESEDFGIRYFSGAATYSKTFNYRPSKQDQRMLLDLGKVCDLAEVTMNGQNLGVIWKLPFRLDITDYLRKGENLLEIKVINPWRNRMIGDEQPDCPEKITYTTLSGGLGASSPLHEAGLMGPVRIISKNSK
mgnify:CR=1 FL=1